MVGKIVVAVLKLGIAMDAAIVVAVRLVADRFKAFKILRDQRSCWSATGHGAYDSELRRSQIEKGDTEETVKVKFCVELYRLGHNLTLTL